MTYSLIKKQIGLAVTCTLALGAMSSTAQAQTDPAERAFLTDSRGVVVRSGTGLCWHTSFGPPPATPNECDSGPAPAPAAKAPATRQIVAAPPATPKPAAARVTLSADTLFDFNKSTLRPAGKTALDEFVVKSNEINPEVIVVVGHADRFGTEAYNQNLSEQRAAVVKSYLLGKGVASNRIHTEGKGEMQPTTKAGECVGAKSAKVIACLQPDRRVDVEVIGSKITR